ncbi:unnamed protein product [Paramecium octaurelia]|uniref:Uncharacterized protein n=1 Tax=Paramecium octaurelia TaxID=43137 RepID=A0A8S1V6E9_PAROT|nr:unnamed protein product [Paramecium octaurelia]
MLETKEIKNIYYYKIQLGNELKIEYFLLKRRGGFINLVTLNQI